MELKISKENAEKEKTWFNGILGVYATDWLALYSEVERLTEMLERLNKLDEMCDTLRRQMNDPTNGKDDILTMITSFKLNYENWREVEE